MCKRDKTFTLLFHGHEKTMVEAAAVLAGISQSELVRRAAVVHSQEVLAAAERRRQDESLAMAAMERGRTHGMGY